MLHLKTILHPTDFSESSQHALELACALAREQDARLLILHVLPRPAAIGRDSAVPAFKDMHTTEDLAAYRQEMAGMLSRARDKADCTNVDTLLKEGPVAEEIARTASETPCDVIVMGTHGRSRMYQLTMGSVATAVSRNAPCPVVTVRVPS